jgi:hypothetical protein
VLAWVRREFDRVFFNQLPTVNYNSAANVVTLDQLVIGELDATDAEGDPFAVSGG